MTTTNEELKKSIGILMWRMQEVERYQESETETVHGSLLVVSALQEVIDMASVAQREAVEQARARRATWEEVGKAVRRTGSAAQQRFGKGAL